MIFLWWLCHESACSRLFSNPVTSSTSSSSAWFSMSVQNFNVGNNIFIWWCPLIISSGREGVMCGRQGVWHSLPSQPPTHWVPPPPQPCVTYSFPEKSSTFIIFLCDDAHRVCHLLPSQPSTHWAPSPPQPCVTYSFPEKSSTFPRKLRTMGHTA